MTSFTPIPSHHLRVVISSYFFMHGLCFSTWASRIPAIQEKMGLSESELGSILFAMPLGSVAVVPMTAWLIARWGSRRILFVALLTNVAILAMIGLIHSRLQLTLGLFLYGLCSNTVNIAVNTQAAQSEVIYRKPIMASYHGLWSSAGFVGASISILMIGAKLSPFIHFFIVAIVIALCAFTGYRFLNIDPPRMPKPPKPSTRFALKSYRPDPTLFSLGIICFCVMLCEGTMFDWSGVYFAKEIHATGSWVVLGYAAFMTTMAGFRFLADRFKERFGLNKILQCCGLTVFSGLMISVLFPNMICATIGFFIVGAGVSAVVPFVLSEAGRHKTMDASGAIAAVSTIGFCGFLVGPPIIGWIAGWTNLRVSFGSIAFLGLCITALAKRRARQSLRVE